MLLSIIKFFHVMCGVSFFGVVIAQFFYIGRSLNKGDSALIDYSIRASYFGDAIVLLCILIQFSTSFPLVSAGNFTLQVPWIFVAYHAFALLTLLWLITFFIKKIYFARKNIGLYPIRFFYLFNIMMILIFIIIIHDAVMQSTGLEFLFRK